MTFHSAENNMIEELISRVLYARKKKLKKDKRNG